MSTATTESPIGPYDPTAMFLVTAPDGSQSFHTRMTRHASAPYAPLSWWRACGFTSEEKTLWSRIVTQPEHALLLVGAGFEASELSWAKLDALRVGDALKWLNPYRAAKGRMPKAWGEFQTFLASISDAGEGLARVNPLRAAQYIRALEGTGIPRDRFVFAASSPGWAEAVARSGAVSGGAPAVVKSLMQVGAAPEALDVILTDSGLTYRADEVQRAIREIFLAGQFTQDAAGYRLVRDLGILLSAAPEAADTVSRLFLSGEDRTRLYSAVIDHRMRDAAALEAVFDEGIAPALVGGFL